MTRAEIPPTRWQLGGPGTYGYAQRFSDLIEQGADIDGEARLADALAPRNARILDAGAGIGRVGVALLRRGHDVLAAEPDPDLVAESRRRWPELPVVEADILALDPAEHGRFDLITVVGNVMILLAEDTERRVLATLASLLKPEGRILAGFANAGGPGRSRDYPWDEFEADATAAGLAVEQRFGTYELHAPRDEYTVVVLHRA